MMKLTGIAISFCVFITVAVFGARPLYAQQIEKHLAAFFGVSPDGIQIECPQQSFRLRGEGADATLNICLNKFDNRKRCEIVITRLGKAPEKHFVSYDFRYEDNTPHKYWNSLMQIHSFPDKGESWRCPPVSLEIENLNLRMYSRWDGNKISSVSGYNCTERGSSIEGRTIFDNIEVQPGIWNRLDFQAVLTDLNNSKGELTVRLNDKQIASLSGPNIFNDERGPFLKLGIYKPTAWEEGHQRSCVTYRNIKIDSVKE